MSLKRHQRDNLPAKCFNDLQCRCHQKMICESIAEQRAYHKWQRLETSRQHKQQVIFSKRRKKGLLEQTDNGSACYATYGEHSCLPILFLFKRRQEQLSPGRLTDNVRRIAVSLFPTTATTSTRTTSRNTNLATSTGAGGRQSAWPTQLCSKLPIGQPFKLTLTFCHWTTLVFTNILLLICLSQILITTVSAITATSTKHSNNNAQLNHHQTRLSQAQPDNVNFIHSDNISQPSSLIGSQRQKQSTYNNNNHYYYYYYNSDIHQQRSPANQATASSPNSTRARSFNSDGTKIMSRSTEQLAKNSIRFKDNDANISGNGDDDDENIDEKVLKTQNHAEQHYGQRISQAKEQHQQQANHPHASNRPHRPLSPSKNSTTTTSKRIVPELTFRHSLTEQSPSTSNWIPIVQSQTPGPSQTSRQQQWTPAGSAFFDHPASDGRTRARAPSTRSPSWLRHRDPMQPTASHHHYYMPVMHPHWPNNNHQFNAIHSHTNNHQHRRPRLNNQYPIETNEIVPIAPSKIYTRVLLCDKTLVSLDYIRSLNSEPRPFTTLAASHQPTKATDSSLPSNGLIDEILNDIGDNLINLDEHYNALASSHTETAPVAAQDQNSTNYNSRSGENASLASPDSLLGRSRTANQIQHHDLVSRSSRALPNPGSVLATNGSSILNATNYNIPSQAASSDLRTTLERRSHNTPLLYHMLNDEDSLIRCDMWDLEKGLKSRKPPEHLLRVAIKADFDTVRDAINRCRQLSEKTLPPEDEYRDSLELMSSEDLMSLFSMKRGLIPGTKWCGLGDQASSYNDLGPKHRIDICCRAHDHCPIRSKPFRNDYGVLNIGLYTKSHCDCDADFYRCLRDVRSRTADMLGNLYFNVMKLQCMREERLKICREAKPIALGFERCIRYEDSPMKTVFKFTTPPVAY